MLFYHTRIDQSVKPGRYSVVELAHYTGPLFYLTIIVLPGPFASCFHIRGGDAAESDERSLPDKISTRYYQLHVHEKSKIKTAHILKQLEGRRVAANCCVTEITRWLRW